ncbi:RNA-binding protein 28, partial [Coelomomyces lativittatus]
PIKQCFVVSDNQNPGQNKGIGFVKFAIPEDAKIALSSNLTLLGNPLSILNAKKRATLAERTAKKRNASSLKDMEEEKPAVKKLKENGTRLIIRNLSFSCTTEKLESVFSSYGKVEESKMPTKASGAYLGFGIVRFEKHSDALKALESVNETEIEGRVVAVDWCLPKDTYKQLEPEPEPRSSKSSSNPVEKKKLKVQVKSKNKLEAVVDKEINENLDSYEKSTASENSSSLMPHSSDSVKPTHKKIKDKKEANQKNKELHSTPHVNEKTTLFIRHLPVDCSKNDLLKIFKPFGMVLYVSILPSNTSHTTAFVCFSTPEAAQECLSKVIPYQPNATVQPELPPNYPFVFNHEVLAIHLALPKADLEQSKEIQKDKRYLYLLNEVPESLISQMKTKLKKCPDYFVSPTRLLFQHVPRTFTKKDLKQLALEPFQKVRSDAPSSSSSSGFPTLKQVVVVKGNEGRNKGYGFVEFRDPEHALKCVRAFKLGQCRLSGVPELSVCFSIENRRIVGLREKRICLQKERKGNSNTTSSRQRS